MNIPVAKPKLIGFDQYSKYLRQIDNNRWYSNNGPLLREFQLQLSKLFNCDNDDVVVLNSATSALTCLLYAIKIKNNYFDQKKYCLLPSWTFIATAVSAVNAGFTPYFVDVDLDSWMVNPEKLIGQIKDIDNIGSIIVTSAFAKPINIDGWIKFSKQTVIPVIIDAAASFDSLLQCPEFYINDTIPIVVSMHATKIFGIGEGGMVLYKNHHSNSLIGEMTNFGFDIDRKVKNLGFNAKLPEYSAAVGLAIIENWNSVRNEWYELTKTYINYLDQAGIKNNLSLNYLKSTCNIILDKINIDEIILKLRQKDIDSRRWWNNGCAMEEPYKNFPKLSLDNTQKLSNSALGIPFYLDQNEKEIEYIVKTINSSLA